MTNASVPEIPVNEVQPAVRGGFRPHSGWPDLSASGCTRRCVHGVDWVTP